MGVPQRAPPYSGGHAQMKVLSSLSIHVAPLAHGNVLHGLELTGCAAVNRHKQYIYYML